jgi:hypothetical protein
MTTATPPPAELPPDPEAYDSVRAQHARARGLAAPYIAGGNDPDPEEGLREERFYVRLLLIFFVAIVLGVFVLAALTAALRAG